VDLKLEVVVVPVSDVDRAKEFYGSLGFREDIDYVGEDDFRVVQFTPPGSECSIIIGKGVTEAAPGSLQELQLVAYDIEEVRNDLIGKGVEVGEIFHDRGGIFHHVDKAWLESGPDPDRGDYASFATFSDPDGNGWVIQEVKQRAPGR
jgi:catechol 2,3-dioxygenase-like lactoylglutathione lyase family enzyme